MSPPSASPSSFVGRSSELARLDAALVGARAGSGRIVILVGDPGIGKTRLAEEFTARARAAGAEVLTGRCFEGPGAPALWPWMQVLRAYVRSRDAATLAAELGHGAPDLAAVLPELHERLAGVGPPPQVPDDQARFRLFDAVTRALCRAAERRPTIVLLEDLHGADRPSLLLLQFLARELRSSHLLVVGTLRDVAALPDHPMFTTLGELVRERVAVELTLTGLARDEVAELIARLTGTPPDAPLVEAVYARTEGNPLYVAEVVRAFPDGAPAVDAVGIPTTVRSTIARRLDMLSPAARATLTRAALFGREFRIDAVARAAGRAIAEVQAHVDEAAAARLVVDGPRPGQYRFAHALFAEALVAALEGSARTVWHADAATALAADVGADELVSEIAYHWFAAGPAGNPPQAVAAAVRAAERASAMLAHEEAAELYRHALVALGWTTAADQAARADLLLGLGEAEKRSGDLAAARAAFEKAAAIGRALAAPTILTRAALGHAPAISYAEQAAPDPEVVHLLEEAIASWQGADATLHARALARLAMALIFGDPAHRLALVAESVAMARRCDDPPTISYALAAALFADPRRDDPAGRLALATQLLTLAQAARDAEGIASGRLFRCIHLLASGDTAGFEAELGELRRVAAELRQPVWDWYVGSLEIVHHMLVGRLAEADAAIDAVLAVGRASMPYAAPAYAIGERLVVRLLQGRAYDAAADEYRALFGSHPDPTALSPMVWAAIEAGNLEEARRGVERLIADDLRGLRESVVGSLPAVFVAYAHEVLDAQEAEAMHRLLSTQATLWTVWAEGAVLGPVSYALALLAEAMGDLDRAAEHFEHALADTRRARALPFVARTLHEYARLLLMRDAPGDAARASDLLAEAAPLAQALGMVSLQQRIAVLRARTTNGEASGATNGGASASVSASPSATPTAGGCLCRREGDYWTFTYDGATVRLRNSRGLGYLAHLLWHPGREFHVSELVRLVAERGERRATADPDLAVERDTGDAGAVLDEEARAAYRRRVTELRDGIAEAEAANDAYRASRLQAELDAIAHELKTASRGRRAVAAAERARVAVTKGIGSALARVRSDHPALGRHLEATVKRGYRCSYVPDPRHPIEWGR